MVGASVKQRKKAKRAKVSISRGRAYIKASFNNTLVYITDSEGNTLSWATAGNMGFRGARKSTPYAGQLAGTKAGQAAKDLYGLQEVELNLWGGGSGREAAARALAACFKVISIKDITGIPHNGCRAEKERRV